jgi:hypothetical protein
MPPVKHKTSGDGVQNLQVFDTSQNLFQSPQKRARQHEKDSITLNLPTKIFLVAWSWGSTCWLMKYNDYYIRSIFFFKHFLQILGSKNIAIAQKKVKNDFAPESGHSIEKKWITSHQIRRDS